MKRPVVAIQVPYDPNIRRKILNADCNITILDGDCDYEVGDIVVIYCYPETWSLLATITSVRHTCFGNITAEEYAAHGCSSSSPNFRDELCRMYPTFTRNPLVTIVRWSNIRGEAKDDWERNRHDYSGS